MGECTGTEIRVENGISSGNIVPVIGTLIFSKTIKSIITGNYGF